MAESADARLIASVDRRKDVFLGQLPEDFLRVQPTTQQLQEVSDHEAAYNLQMQQNAAAQGFTPSNVIGTISITVLQAKLAKNYGMTRMDPYARLRVGHTVYETQTDSNGAKTPRWHRTFQCYIPRGVDSVFIEVFDECAFTPDELIAWATVPIPANVLRGGETHEDWYPLSGKEGENKEGMMNLIFSYLPLSGAPMATRVIPGQVPLVAMYSPVYNINPCYSPMPVTVAPVPYGQVVQPDPPRRPPQLTDDLLQELKSMFPNIEESVIKSVFEVSRGDKTRTINCLLELGT